jgi:two-component system, NarL family, sensor histidine kinase LiaS
MLADNVNLFFSGTGIKVNAEIDDAGMEELSANVKTNILLIIKEALANVIKHAKASNVNLLLYSSNNKIHIEVGDDGMGFSNWFTNGKSLGLNSIKNRIEKINGDFNLESKIKGGTRLRVIIPVK